ncbi:MAG: aspartate-semialdehyde dehydrogenase [Opitutales bacterium]|nr:aspartate-semialdehyde dehydrogenase [Opitutales bacterium]
MNKKYKVGIVGATGAVGQEVIKLLFQRNFPMESLTLLASSRSAGKEIKFEDKTFIVEEAKPESFEKLDIAIFSAGGTPSKELVPECAKRGCIAIDNSSAFRMDPNVPLIVPEVNPHAIKNHKNIIANPNCTTAISLMALYPLHKKFGLKRFFAATYQAVSGTGVAAMDELKSQMKAIVDGTEPQVNVYPYQIAYNVLPHVDVFLDNDYTKEEMKMLNETRKILELPDILNSTTCVRVPVMRAHSVAINAEFERPVSVEEARKAISEFSGAELVDEPADKKYPMPLHFQCKEKCGVGRIRKDLAFENGLSFWVAGDQLWKGAALNAVQIAELIASQK